VENDGIGLMATLPAIVVEEVDTIEAAPAPQDPRGIAAQMWDLLESSLAYQGCRKEG
jgi:hypothetical protein